MGRHRVPLRYAKQKWRENKQRQEKMGNVFELSFEDWYQFWLDNGEDKNLTGTGYGKNSQVLVRIDESKSFTKDNIQTMTRGKSNLGRPCRSLGRQRPQTWIIKDPELHRMYLPFLKARSQTAFRVREGLAEGDWRLSFEEFVALWGDLWDLRGRQSDDFAMTREDLEKDWDFKNTIVVTRAEQLRRAHEHRMATGKIKGWKGKK